MLYRGHFSLAHWSHSGEQLWVRYCAEFHADEFETGGAVLRKLASRKMQEVNASGIRIDKIDLLTDGLAQVNDQVDCMGIFASQDNGGETMVCRV